MLKMSTNKEQTSHNLRCGHFEESTLIAHNIASICTNVKKELSINHDITLNDRPENVKDNTDHKVKFSIC